MLIWRSDMAWVRCGKHLMLSWLAFPVLQASAAGPAAVPSTDFHQVVFRYEKDTAYTILAQPGVPTDLQLAADEKIQGLALGDTVQWMIEELPGHLFIKPVRGNLFTAGTLVTDRRVYQLMFKSSDNHDQWYQRVSWEYADKPPAGVARVDLLPDPDQLAPGSINSDYEIEGEGDFRPVRVFDDGKFTYLKMKSPQSLPALFMLQEEGAVLVNYRVQGEYFVVQRLMPGILLKLGNREIRVLNRKLGAALMHKLKPSRAPVNPFNLGGEQ
jgi:type IV secretion system protein VirB9